MSTTSRNKASCLCHDDNKSRLTQQSTLSCHIRTCHNDNLLLLVVEIHIIGYIGLTGWHLCLYDRMASFPDIKYTGVINNRTYVMTFPSQCSKAQEAIQLRKGYRGFLHDRNVCLSRFQKLCIYLSFKYQHTVFCSQYLGFIILQFLSNIAFSLCQCLLSYPFWWNLVFERIPDFQIISEHIVETYLQTADTCTFSFPSLDFQKVFLTGRREISQFIQFLIDTIGNISTLIGERRRIRQKAVSNMFPQVRTIIHTATKVSHGRKRCLSAGL